MKEKCFSILDFLKKYSGHQYRKKEKCASEEECNYMIAGREAGISAREAFGCLVSIIENRCELEHDKITQWQNSGTFVSYFWCQMKRHSRKDSQISLSLFAEKTVISFRFRISVELAIEKALAEDLIRYSKLLDKPLDAKLVYVSGGNNENEFRILDERDNNAVRAMGLKKVQVSAIIEENQLDDDLLQLISDLSDSLLPYYDSLFEETIIENKSEEEPQGGEEEMADINTKDAIAEIQTYIFTRGFDYPDGLIENFYLSLRSKPFVILAGISGTGKTRLVKLFAEAMGAAFHLVSVRPDWSDGSDLFGHTDLNGNFIPGPVCAAFEAARREPDRPVFLCLDEMNLARVEYYLSDFLSVIESREKVHGHVVTERIAQYENGIPENLYVVGTVNMDETTFPFSKKVLDRANTIEFSYVDLMPKQRTMDMPAPQKLPNSFLRTEYLILAADCMEEADLVEKICTELQALNGKLVKANAHVGFRVRDEIVFYMLNNRKAGDLLTYEQAMDNEIMQKILPRIQGSSAAIKTLLIDMFKFCMGSGAGIDADTGNVGEQMKNAAASAKYPESARKIGYMMTRFEDDGFTSYWL